MPYQPPYQITQKILSPVAQISETMGQTRMAALQNSPQVREQYQQALVELENEIYRSVA